MFFKKKKKIIKEPSARGFHVNISAPQMYENRVISL